MILSELLQQMAREIGCSINVELTCSQMWTTAALSLPASLTVHSHDYCRFIKRHDANYSCSLHKHYTMRIAAYGRRFYGSCPYGMWELVQPVIWQGRLACILYFGGYCDPEKLPELGKFGKFYGDLPRRITPEKTAEIKKSAAFAADFIRRQLDISANSAVSSAEKIHNEAYYLAKIRSFVSEKFQEDVSINDLAKICRLSPNYLCNFIKRHTGRTFKQLLTEQRLAEAEACLKYRHNMTITDIAIHCGYNDSNYFSTVFRSYFSCSPRQYRTDWNNQTYIVKSVKNK
jgi:AraC-like DNA-binding protein